MKRYHGVSPLEQKRSMPAWLAKPSFVIGLLIVLVTCFEPQGIIGVAKRIQSRFTRKKEAGGDGKIETHS